MPPLYKEHEVLISSKQKKKLERALKAKKPTLSIKLQQKQQQQQHNDGRGGGGDKGILLLTKRQIVRIEKAKAKNKPVTIQMSKRQLRANTTFKGGFLGMLAGLAARALPSLLTGLASGLISGAVERAVSGNGVYIKKGKHCYRADPVEGNGLFLSRQPRRTLPVSLGDGLFVKHGRDVHNGKGLLFGQNSPFKNIPILGWFL